MASWKEKGKVCSHTELREFKNEWLRLKSQLSRNARATIALAMFESEWVGYCKSCVRPIPSSREYCPFCRDEAGEDQ